MSNPTERRGKFMNAREQIIAKNAWAITRSERDKLDHFFLVKQTWESIADDFTYDDVEMKRFLHWEGKEYEVNLLRPVRVLKAAPLLGLSFRVHKATEIRIVLIREWEDQVNTTTQEEVTNG